MYTNTGKVIESGIAKIVRITCLLALLHACLTGSLAAQNTGSGYQGSSSGAGSQSGSHGSIQIPQPGMQTGCFLNPTGQPSAFGTDQSDEEQYEGQFPTARQNGLPPYSQQNNQYPYSQQNGQYPTQQGSQYPSLQEGDQDQLLQQYQMGQSMQQGGQYQAQQGQFPMPQQGGQMSQFGSGGQAGGQYGGDGTYQSQYAGAPMIPTFQIIATLQQTPDLLNTLKLNAGQQVGRDPLTITDMDIFSCVEQNQVFRSQVSNLLITEGYITLSQSDQTGFANQPGLTNQPGITNQLGSRAPTPSRNLPMVPIRPQIRPEEQPDTVRLRKPIPYYNLPSLKDLYSQVIPNPAKLRRFGSDVFLFGTGNSTNIPMDLPAGSDYVLGPGDAVTLNLWGSQSIRLSRTIDRQGEIALPEAGTIAIAGMTIARAQDAIQHALGTQFQNERAELSLGRVRSVRVYVVGDVQWPGAFDISSLSTPLNALYAAGGPTSRGSLRTLRQMRGNTLVREIDLYDFLLHGVRADVDRLQPGDTILVPPTGAQVTVAGLVRRPAIYEIKGAQDLKDVLDLAGGVLPAASLNQIRVERVEAHDHHEMLSVTVSENAKGEITDLAPFSLQDGDIVTVLPILPVKEQVVYLDGHVFKPGPYAWHDGMTVTDMVHSYQDVMPEPSNHAEIIRLAPPDLHPTTIEIDLADVLIGNTKVTLQPFDTIRLFSRYEIDPPKVSIFGEVIRPGFYPMSNGMTVAGLVRMAGGLRRSAFRDEADLSSYGVQNGKKVQVSHSVVSLQKALDGDSSADVALKPGDVVGVRQLTGWKDIGGAVQVTGEVGHPGMYGIEAGERLSSLLRRAGGFTDVAYPAGAVLDRVQVREFEEQNRQEMIRRVENTTPNAGQGLGTAQEQQTLLQAMMQQQQQVLASLRGFHPRGRLVIRITRDISRWENTSADIELRPGDTLVIPKRPDFVLVSGQVYNATGINFHAGKDASWYLQQSGGVMRNGDKGAIFIVRADGSVVGRKNGLFGQSVLKLRLRPGDSLVVPEKVIGGSQAWKNIISLAQVGSSVAITGAVAGIF